MFTLDICVFQCFDDVLVVVDHYHCRNKVQHNSLRKNNKMISLIGIEVYLHSSIYEDGRIFRFWNTSCQIPQQVLENKVFQENNQFYCKEEPCLHMERVSHH